jgi:hypothetical protein
MPLEQRFWDDLIANKTAAGIKVYEQDWMHAHRRTGCMRVEAGLAALRIARALMRNEPHCERARCAASLAIFAGTTSCKGTTARCRT